MNDDNKLKIVGAAICAIVGISVIVGFFIIPLLTPTPIPDEPPYEPPFEPHNAPQIASDNYVKVFIYNETIWNDIFGNETNPTNLFGLNSDKILYNASMKTQL